MNDLTPPQGQFFCEVTASLTIIGNGVGTLRFEGLGPVPYTVTTSAGSFQVAPGNTYDHFIGNTATNVSVQAVSVGGLPAYTVGRYTWI
ncbi:MAG: hypothetical protein QM775_35080 [Pirellulales bacterium]